MAKQGDWVRDYSRQQGFTVVELMIAIVIVVVLATITTLVYQSVQRQASVSTVEKALSDMQKAVVTEELRQNRVPAQLPDTVQPQDDIELDYQIVQRVRYSNLSPVQNGVLFQSICEELIQDPYYSQIHARIGGQTSSVVMKCDDNIAHDKLLITGWDSKTWHTPLTRADLQDYIDAVPYDSWWVDRQAVVQGFYAALISRFEARGGSWPITSFWDYYNPVYGVPKEELPPPDPALTLRRYCIAASHTRYDDIHYKVTSDNPILRAGVCSN